MRSSDQILHDRINLPRVVKRLEHIVQDTNWIVEGADEPGRRDSWIKARGTLQQIYYARVLLKNVELDDPHTTPSSEKQRQHIRTTVTRLEKYMRNIEEQLTPPFQRPSLILPSIPPPISHHPLSQEGSKPASPSVEATLIPAEDSSSIRNIVYCFISPPVTIPCHRYSDNPSKFTCIAGRVVGATCPHGCAVA